MKKQTKFPIPPYFLFLDTVGAILVGIGLAKYFGQIDVIPAVMRFNNYEIYFMVFGFVIMLPMIFHIVAKARSIQGQKEP